MNYFLVVVWTGHNSYSATTVKSLLQFFIYSVLIVSLSVCSTSTSQQEWFPPGSAVQVFPIPHHSNWYMATRHPLRVVPPPSVYYFLEKKPLINPSHHLDESISSSTLPSYSYHDSRQKQNKFSPREMIDIGGGGKVFGQMNNKHFLSDSPLKKVTKCEGKNHLLSDFGIISLMIGAVSTIIGFTLDLVLTLKGNMITFLATVFGLLFSVPNAILSLLGISSPFVYYLGNGLNFLGFTPTIFGASGINVGNVGLLTGIFFEILGIIGLVVSVISSFPELLDDFIEYGELFGYGDELKDFIDNYGCRNPYLPNGNITIESLGF